MVVPTLTFKQVNKWRYSSKIRILGKCINNGHRKDAIFTGLRTAAELPPWNLNATRYVGVACFREDAGLFLSALGVTIGRPKKSRAGCVDFYVQVGAGSKEENGKGADLFHGVDIGTCRLISFPRWLVRDRGRYEHPVAVALFSRRVVLIHVFGFLSCATKECRKLFCFRSLDGLRMTDGELSVDLREKAVSEIYRRCTAPAPRELTSVATRCRTA
jgi:hypothetical protein